MSTGKAAQACMPCKTLKRKCTKELPTCSLCMHLHKQCNYPSQSKVSGSGTEDVSSLSRRIEKLEQRLEGELSQSSGHTPSSQCSGFASVASSVASNWRMKFPVTYFLDLEVYHQIHSNQLNAGVAVPMEILDVLESKMAMQSVFETYMSCIQSWLPMLSKKRISDKIDGFSPAVDAAFALLLLSMMLASNISPEQEAVAIAPLYRMTKAFYSKVEESGVLSLQLLQSAIIISVYEIGHAIYPAAYLSISHAARLGMMMGFHDGKHGTRLFKEADTWTQCEEERRTWWVIVLLERYVNLGIARLPLATPEPSQGTLLPCLESSWDQGRIGSNVPLFASSFNSNTEIDSFASACQASHILGLVLRHRDDHTIGMSDTHFRLSEAQRLHQTLVLLNTHLERRPSAFTDDPNIAVAAALCYAGRFVLYSMYACNEHYSPTGARIPEETDMQQASIKGLKEVTHSISQLARHIFAVATTTDSLLFSKSLLLCHCLYQASTEYAWFLREQKSIEDVVCLTAIVQLLRAIGRRWRVAVEYLRILEVDNSLAAITA